MKFYRPFNKITSWFYTDTIQTPLQRIPKKYLCIQVIKFSWIYNQFTASPNGNFNLTHGTEVEISQMGTSNIWHLDFLFYIANQ